MTKAEDKIVEALSPQLAQIRLTETMINKYIIDAKSDVQTLARLFGVEYDQLGKGEKHYVNAFWHDGTEAKIGFYRANTRGDKRVSISGIKQQAQPDDLISLSYMSDKSGKIYIAISVVNVTAIAEERTEICDRVAVQLGAC